jgi:hypothetical protein
MEWFYVFSRDQSNDQIDLQRFKTLDEANTYKTTMSIKYWDSVVIKQSDMELFNFFGDGSKNNSSYYEIGKL